MGKTDFEKVVKHLERRRDEARNWAELITKKDGEDRARYYVGRTSGLQCAIDNIKELINNG